MGNLFGAREVIEMSIQIEHNGRDFYTAAIAAARSPEAAEIFRLLREEEDDHIRVFEELREQADDYEPPPDEAAQYQEYLKSLAAEHVFTGKKDGAQLGAAITGDAQAVDLATGFEKDSVLFYTGMKKVVPPSGHRVIDRIIEQEKEHIRRLAELRKRIQ